MTDYWRPTCCSTRLLAPLYLLYGGLVLDLLLVLVSSSGRGKGPRWSAGRTEQTYRTSRVQACIDIAQGIILVATTISAFVQLVLDFRLVRQRISDISQADTGQKFQCFSCVWLASPNMRVPMSFVVRLFLISFGHDADGNVEATHPLYRLGLGLSLVTSMFVCLFYLPVFFTHILPGCVAYGWIFCAFYAVFDLWPTAAGRRRRLWFVLACAGMVCYMAGLYFFALISGHSSLYLYDGSSYWDSLHETLTERSADAFFGSMSESLSSLFRTAYFFF